MAELGLPTDPWVSAQDCCTQLAAEFVLGTSRDTQISMAGW